MAEVADSHNFKDQVGNLNEYKMRPGKCMLDLKVIK